MAVQFLADGHVGEQVLVVCDVGHYIAGDDAGPFPAWRAHLVGRDAEYHCGGVNEMMDECWGHGLNNFRDWHPIVDFTGKPSVILGVPLTSVHITPSNDHYKTVKPKVNFKLVVLTPMFDSLWFIYYIVCYGISWHIKPRGVII